MNNKGIWNFRSTGLRLSDLKYATVILETEYVYVYLLWSNPSDRNDFGWPMITSSGDGVPSNLSFIEYEDVGGIQVFATPVYVHTASEFIKSNIDAITDAFMLRRI